jgi:pyruvate kinase
MLESMITSPVPTRAEVSDVSTAIFEGADAIMLSAESAAGQYPVEAVATMNRIAEEVESDRLYRTIIHAQRTEPEATGADAIAAAAGQIAETLELAAIISWTSSGSTALRVARERPHRRSWRSRRGSPPAGGSRWSGGCTASWQRTPMISMTWWNARAASPARTGSPKPGQRVIIVAGVPLARRARPTCCVLRSWGAEAAKE